MSSLLNVIHAIIIEKKETGKILLVKGEQGLEIPKCGSTIDKKDPMEEARRVLSEKVGANVIPIRHYLDLGEHHYYLAKFNGNSSPETKAVWYDKDDFKRMEHGTYSPEDKQVISQLIQERYLG